MRLEDYVVGSTRLNGTAVEERVFGCAFCAFSGSKPEWATHLRGAHADRGLMFCRKGGSRNPCGVPFSSTVDMENHVAEVHYGKKPPAPPMLPSQSSALAVSGDGDDGHMCQHCGMLLGSLKSYRIHLEMEHGEVWRPEVEDVKATPPSPEIAVDHNDSKYRCGANECGRSFYSQLKLDDHVRSQHTKERPYVCSYCGDSFFSKATMAQHEKKQHLDAFNGGGGGYDQRSRAMCKICGKSFHVNYLGTHMRTHAGAEDYACTVCGKEFSSRQARIRHEAIHFGDKKHSCQFCGKSFVQKVNMEAHERIHTGARPYLCAICGEGFAQGTRRNQHQKTCGTRRASLTAEPLPPEAMMVAEPLPLTTTAAMSGPPVLNVPHVPIPNVVATPPPPAPTGPPHLQFQLQQPLQVQLPSHQLILTPQQQPIALTLQPPPYHHLQSPPPAVMSPAASDAGSGYDVSPAPPSATPQAYFWSPPPEQHRNSFG